MKAISVSSLLVAIVFSVLTQAATHSFADSNSYYLHALHSDAQNEYINTLSSYGAKVVRLRGKLLHSYSNCSLLHRNSVSVIKELTLLLY